MQNQIIGPKGMTILRSIRALSHEEFEYLQLQL